MSDEVAAIPGLTIRPARREEVATIVRLLADDALGQQREAIAPELLARYERAFAAIEADPNNELLVATLGDEVIGTFQLTFIPGLSFQGSTRAQIESVRVATQVRGQGIGAAMMRWAIAQARARGCRLVQLSTNKQRHEAHRFYQRLGFVASHEGMKLDLGGTTG